MADTRVELVLRELLCHEPAAVGEVEFLVIEHLPDLLSLAAVHQIKLGQYTHAAALGVVFRLTDVPKCSRVVDVLVSTTRQEDAGFVVIKVGGHELFDELDQILFVVTFGDVDGTYSGQGQQSIWYKHDRHTYQGDRQQTTPEGLELRP